MTGEKLCGAKMSGPNFMHSDGLKWIVYTNEVDQITA